MRKAATFSWINCCGFDCISTKLTCAVVLLEWSGPNMATEGNLLSSCKLTLKQRIPLSRSCHHFSNIPNAVTLVSCSQTPRGGRGVHTPVTLPLRDSTREDTPAARGLQQEAVSCSLWPCCTVPRLSGVKCACDIARREQRELNSGNYNQVRA